MRYPVCTDVRTLKVIECNLDLTCVCEGPECEELFRTAPDVRDQL